MGVVRRTPWLLLAALAFSACAKSSPAACCGPLQGALTAKIAYVNAFLWPGGPGAPQPSVQPLPLVMYDEQFLNPATASYLLALQISPAVQNPTIAWTSSNPAVASLQSQEPGAGSLPGDPAPTAPPAEMFVQTGTAYGAATITGSATAPVNAGATMTAYHYPSLALGCRFRYEPAFAFDPDRTALMQQQSNWTSADLYDTFPSNQLGPLDPCLNSPLASPANAPEVWHAPYGGVLLPAVSLQAFTAVGVSQWQNAGTSFAPSASALLLLKTKEGRIVKVLLPTGPYEASSPGGPFPY